MMIKGPTRRRPHTPARKSRTMSAWVAGWRVLSRPPHCRHAVSPVAVLGVFSRRQISGDAANALVALLSRCCELAPPTSKATDSASIEKTNDELYPTLKQCYVEQDKLKLKHDYINRINTSHSFNTLQTYHTTAIYKPTTLIYTHYFMS